MIRTVASCIPLVRTRVLQTPEEAMRTAAETMWREHGPPSGCPGDLGIAAWIDRIRGLEHRLSEKDQA